MICKNFFWDFDGTLYATYGRITRACLKALADAGKDIQDIPFEEAYRAAKRSIKHFSDRYAAPRGLSHDEFTLSVDISQEKPHSLIKNIMKL